MLLQDQLFILTSQLLKLNENEFDQVTTDFAANFGVDLIEPKKINSYSFASLDITESLISYRDWIKDLRLKSFINIKYVRLGSIPKIPQKILEQYSAEEKVIQISSDKLNRFFVFETIYSRSTHISGSELLELINSQFKNEADCYELWMELLNSCVKNYGSYFDASTVEDAKRFMRQYYDIKSSSNTGIEILRIIQYFLAEKKQPFIIPTILKNKLVKPESNSNDLMSNLEILPHLKDEALSSNEITMLIDAQNGGEKLWQLLLLDFIRLTENSEEHSGKFNNMMSETETREALLKMDSSYLSLGDLFLRFFDFKKNIEIIIPPPISEKIICPKPHLVKHIDLFTPALNPEPWTMMAFRYICQNSADINLKAMKTKDNHSVLFTDLKSSLNDALDIAKKSSSPFYELFSLSIWLLEAGDLDFETSDGKSKIYSDVANSGFSDRAQNFLKESEIPYFLCTIKFPSQKIKIALIQEFVKSFFATESWANEDSSHDESINQRKYIMTDVYNSLRKAKSSLDLIL